VSDVAHGPLVWAVLHSDGIGVSQPHLVQFEWMSLFFFSVTFILINTQNEKV
jgi:hypothetical protein